MTEPETQDACLAVQFLCNQFAQKFIAERDELAKIEANANREFARIIREAA